LQLSDIIDLSFLAGRSKSELELDATMTRVTTKSWAPAILNRCPPTVLECMKTCRGTFIAQNMGLCNSDLRRSMGLRSERGAFIWRKAVCPTWTSESCAWTGF